MDDPYVIRFFGSECGIG